MAAMSRGYSVYRTPTGKEVKVTCVTDGRTHNTRWNDIQYVGEVTDWVRNESTYAYTYKSYGWHPPVNHTIQSQPESEPPQIPVTLDKDSGWSNEKQPCPLKYYGTGECTCGECPKRK